MQPAAALPGEADHAANTVHRADQDGTATSIGISCFAFSDDSSRILDSNTPNTNRNYTRSAADAGGDKNDGGAGAGGVTKDADDDINGLVVVSDIKPSAGGVLVDDAENPVTPDKQASFLAVHPGASHEDGLSPSVCLSSPCFSSLSHSGHAAMHPCTHVHDICLHASDVCIHFDYYSAWQGA